MTDGPQSILHVCSRETILDLRDQILKLHGYNVESTLSLDQALQYATAREHDLVVIDVEGDGRIPAAEKLCNDIKKLRPGQEIVFICNYRVSIESECPDEVIRSEFNPAAMIEGIQAILRKKA
jgi:DNA-binding NtrC family response regulator